MKVYLMTDMEGVAGVMNSTDWIYTDSRYYEKGKELLTKEVNAAIAGFIAAGADEIIVQDGHGKGAVDITLLDSRAKLQRGWDGPYPFGMDERYDVMAWVGQHPKAGTEYGHLCHTLSFNVLDWQVNGISVGEFGMLAFLGQIYNIVPIFVSGCAAFTKEAQDLVKGIETVAVKEGIMAGSGDDCTTEEYERRNWGAIHLQPEKSRKLIREGAERALRRYVVQPQSFQPTKIYAPYSKKIQFRETNGNEGYVYELNQYDDLVELLNYRKK